MCATRPPSVFTYSASTVLRRRIAEMPKAAPSKTMRLAIAMSPNGASEPVTGNPLAAEEPFVDAWLDALA